MGSKAKRQAFYKPLIMIFSVLDFGTNVSYFRVWSGTIKPRSRILGVPKDS